MTTPTTVPISVYRGDCKHWKLTLFTDPDATVPYDLAGLTVAAEIRNGTALATINPVVTLPNIIDLELTAEESAKVKGPARWDCQLTSDDCVTTVAAGPVTITGDVTQ